ELINAAMLLHHTDEGELFSDVLLTTLLVVLTSEGRIDTSTANRMWDSWPRLARREQPPAYLPGGGGASRLGAGDGDVGEDERHAGGAAGEPLEVAADGGDVLEHALQGGGHGRLPDRLGERAVADAEALDADREVARDGV